MKWVVHSSGLRRRRGEGSIVEKGRSSVTRPALLASTYRTATGQCIARRSSGADEWMDEWMDEDDLPTYLPWGPTAPWPSASRI